MLQNLSLLLSPHLLLFISVWGEPLYQEITVRRGPRLRWPDGPLLAGHCRVFNNLTHVSPPVWRIHRSDQRPQYIVELGALYDSWQWNESEQTSRGKGSGVTSGDEVKAISGPRPAGHTGVLNAATRYHPGKCGASVPGCHWGLVTQAACLLRLQEDSTSHSASESQCGYCPQGTSCLHCSQPFLHHHKIVYLLRTSFISSLTQVFILFFSPLYLFLF